MTVPSVDVGVRIGPCRVAIEGEGTIPARLRDELLGARPDPDGAADSPTDLRIRIAGREPDIGRTSVHQLGRRFPYRFRTTLGTHGITFALAPRLGPPLYTVTLTSAPHLDAPCIEATVTTPFQTPSLLRAAASGVNRIAGRDFSPVDALVAKNLMYEIVDPLLWLSLLRRGATFVHAGAVEDPAGRGVLLMGTGGVGKTTTVLDLVLNRGFRYLADDLVILEDGVLVRHPKHLQIYAYNQQLVPGVEERLLAGRSVWDRAMWSARKRLLGPSQTRRRVPAGSLYGDAAVAERSPLCSAIMLTSIPSGEELTLGRAEAVDLASHATNVICDEFWDSLRFLNVAAGLSPSAVNIGALQARATDIMNRALHGVDCFELRVPRGTAGPQLSDAIMRHAGIG